MSITTLLVLTGDGVPPYSARGLRQTLEPIARSSALERTVNGELIDMAPPQMRKFKSTITCSDQQAPAFNGVWPGDLITVDTVVDLGYLTAQSVPAHLVAGSFVDGAYTFYRLRLSCRVAAWSADRDEFGAVSSWKLDVEEI
jgi:hypothetical protein